MPINDQIRQEQIAISARAIEEKLSRAEFKARYPRVSQRLIDSLPDSAFYIKPPETKIITKSDLNPLGVSEDVEGVIPNATSVNEVTSVAAKAVREAVAAMAAEEAKAQAAREVAAVKAKEAEEAKATAAREAAAAKAAEEATAQAAREAAAAEAAAEAATKPSVKTIEEPVQGTRVLVAQTKAAEEVAKPSHADSGLDDTVQRSDTGDKDSFAQSVANIVEEVAHNPKVQNVMHTGTEFAYRARDAIEQALPDAVDMVQRSATAVKDAVTKGGAHLVDQAAHNPTAQDLMRAGTEFAHRARDSIGRAAQAAPGVVLTVQRSATAVKDAFGQGVANMADIAAHNPTAQDLMRTGTEFAHRARDSIGRAAPGVVLTVQRSATAVKDAFGQGVANMADIAAQAAHSPKVQSVMQAGTELVDKATDSIGRALPDALETVHRSVTAVKDAVTKGGAHLVDQAARNPAVQNVMRTGADVVHKVMDSMTAAKDTVVKATAEPAVTKGGAPIDPGQGPIQAAYNIISAPMSMYYKVFPTPKECLEAGIGIALLIPRFGARLWYGKPTTVDSYTPVVKEVQADKCAKSYVNDACQKETTCIMQDYCEKDLGGRVEDGNCIYKCVAGEAPIEPPLPV